MKKSKSIATLIADSAFLLPAWILILSLKEQSPEMPVHVLGISLRDSEKAIFTQIPGVRVFDSTIAHSTTPGAMRVIADLLKGEALLSAADTEEEWIALLDADSLVVGDLTPYLAPGEPALYARTRSPEEDDRIFRFYRAPGDDPSGIPTAFLDRWREDVGQRETPIIQNTVLSGNLIIHRRYLDFVRDWQSLMKTVLDPVHPDRIHPAYYMPAEFALTAWMMFGANPPPLRDVPLNSDPDNFLAHLGPAPRYWQVWPVKKLKYFDRVTRLLEQAERDGLMLPPLPFALKRRNKPLVFAIAWGREALIRIKQRIKALLSRHVSKRKLKTAG